MQKILALAIIILLGLSSQITYAQGCVAIRGGGAVCTQQEAEAQNQPQWQLNLNHRYFHSYKHFVGTVEQKERVEAETDVRNFSHTLNMTLVRQLNSRWSVLLDVPLISNARSSKYEHYGNTNTSPLARRETHSFGLGDIRIAANYWLFNPATSTKGNLQVGLGIKLPTGDYNYQDQFWRNDTTYVYGPVDQSIQLGDGGTGISLELNGYLHLNQGFGLYGNFFYLSNPREQNGTSTGRGSAVTATAIKFGTATMSVADQYMWRIGANYMQGKFTAAAGLRMEGIPAEDLIGGNMGFRRPGYILNAEPSMAYHFKHFLGFASVPVALRRNRVQSYSDKLRTAATGTWVQGDAAFADYAINVGMIIKL
jgi:hypothetical protein